MSNKPKFTMPTDIPFGEEQTPEAAYAATYGPVSGLPDTGRIVAKLTSIYAWRADMRQPRRAIPANIRGDWNGDPVALPQLFVTWIGYVKRTLGVDIPMEKAVKGEWDRPGDIDDAEAATLIDLVDLAASIYKDGLINPMRGAKGVIESGERRWLAYHLLNLFSGEDFSKIPTVEKTDVDVWAQAAENGSRTPLNAIQMARQVALLIMDMFAGDAGVTFERFETLVLPGEADRRYYAQVARGDLYRIKRGLGERILNVTGLKTMERVRQFRALLSIPDMLWVQADAQGWSERQIRDYVDNTKANNPGVTQLHTVTGVTVSTDEPATVEGKAIPETERVRGVSGLYVDRPKPTSPPTPKTNLTPTPSPKRGEGSQRADVRAKYDDDFDDVEEVDAVGYDLPEDSSYPPGSDEWEQPESLVALLATWDAQGNKTRPVLELLKQLAEGNPQLKQKLIEIMTVSPENLRQWQRSTISGWWRGQVQAIYQMLGLHVDQVINKQLESYLEFLLQEGERIRQKHER